MIGNIVPVGDCLPAGSSGQQVRVGVIRVAPGTDAPGTYVVAWYECLTLPGGDIPTGA
jgi:hypothetical protein